MAAASDNLNSSRGIKLSSVFFLVFIAVFTIGGLISIAGAFMAPKSYAGTAKVAVKSKESDNKLTRAERVIRSQILFLTESNVILSGTVIGNAISALNLNVTWGKKYYSGETLKTWESTELLIGRTMVRPLPDTDIILIRCYDDNPKEAAVLANGIANAYVKFAETNALSPVVLFIDPARPLMVPVNNGMLGKLLKIGSGLFIATVIGAIAGLGAVGLAHQMKRANKFPAN